MKNFILIASFAIALLVACKKVSENLSQTDQLSPQLIIDWNNVHFRLIKGAGTIGHIAYSRHFAYTGIALYESLVQGSKKYRSIIPLLNGPIQLPPAPHGNKIYYPAAANAAIADLMRFYYTGKTSNLASADSLEAAYKSKFETEAHVNHDIHTSIEFGKTIAAKVIEWSKSDGASGASIPYAPLGTGYWEPTPPAFGLPAVPGWGNNRPIIAASLLNTLPDTPPIFSEKNNSPFFLMAKEVYDASLSLTTDQKMMANFWDDNPNGKYISAFGHWFSILNQTLQKENPGLMKAADAYLRLGIAMNDAGISCWKAKYSFNQMRPITFIRKIMGNGGWNSLIGTPAHPEYVAAHATLSASAAYTLESIFGRNYAFMDDTYTELGMPPRNYPSFEAAGIEAGLSRLFGGIHYRLSIKAGNKQGKKVAENIQSIFSNRQ